MDDSNDSKKGLITQAREKTRNWLGWLVQHLVNKRMIIIGAIGLLILIMFHSFIKSLISLVLLFAFGGFSTYYKRKLESFGAIGFEFVTFTTLITGVAFGPLVGALFGFVTALVSVMVSRDVGPTTAVFLFATAGIGATAQMLSGHISVVILGLLAILFSAITVQFFTFFIQSELELKIMAATGIMVNLVFNYLLLLYLAKPILAVIT